MSECDHQWIAKTDCKVCIDGWAKMLSDDAALRARYASAVRTLQRVLEIGRDDYLTLSDMNTQMFDTAESGLTQLGEPVEQGETT